MQKSKSLSYWEVLGRFWLTKFFCSRNTTEQLSRVGNQEKNVNYAREWEPRVSPALRANLVLANTTFPFFCSFYWFLWTFHFIFSLILRDSTVSNVLPWNFAREIGAGPTKIDAHARISPHPGKKFPPVILVTWILARFYYLCRMRRNEQLPLIQHFYSFLKATECLNQLDFLQKNWTHYIGIETPTHNLPNLI